MGPRARELRGPLFSQRATREMQMAGNPEHRMKAAGGWADMGFRICIDTQMAGAPKITRLLVSSMPNTDIEDDDGELLLLHRASRSEDLRRGLRISPCRELLLQGPYIDCGKGPWVFNIRA